ncbi:hypothetical protein TrLO_g7012 [Triparma laevis f. longispina]|uniref:Uncharacterized protein n=1 Tax=Triparma laevis f. longispina TaxID=1714387 RepID=A0A9W7AJA3_9STRA|nr:hypothetical protein TrLO_g7012 [Triparma laevis f. longispina]
MFLRNCDPNFDRSLFWMLKTGKQHIRDCWNNPIIRKKHLKTKDNEIYEAWIENTHLTYLPFDAMTPWICKKLVEKYEDDSVERPTWMNNTKVGDTTNEVKFVKRIVQLYTWKESYVDKVKEALEKLFGRSGEDLENGVGGQLTFSKGKKSKKRLGKVEPEPL